MCVVAAIDVVSVGSMLWRDNPSTQLLIVWLNLVGIAGCLVYMRSVAAEGQITLPDLGRTTPSRRGDFDATPRATVPKERPVRVPVTTGVAGASSAERLAPGLEEFPSELETTHRRVG